MPWDQVFLPYQDQVSPWHLANLDAHLAVYWHGLAPDT